METVSIFSYSEKHPEERKMELVGLLLVDLGRLFDRYSGICTYSIELSSPTSASADLRITAHLSEVKSSPVNPTGEKNSPQ